MMLPILLTTVGEFILKHAINVNTTADTIQTLGIFDGMVNALQNPMIVSAYICIFLGSILWLIALSKYELSFLYPFLSLSFLFITIGSEWLLDEHVSSTRYIAVLLIIVGLIIISRSPNNEKEHEYYACK